MIDLNNFEHRNNVVWCDGQPAVVGEPVDGLFPVTRNDGEGATYFVTCVSGGTSIGAAPILRLKAPRIDWDKPLRMQGGEKLKVTKTQPQVDGTIKVTFEQNGRWYYTTEGLLLGQVNNPTYFSHLENYTPQYRSLNADEMEALVGTSVWCNKELESTSWTTGKQVWHRDSGEELSLFASTNYVVELDNGDRVVGFADSNCAMLWPDSRCNFCGSNQDSDEAAHLVAVYELEPVTQAQPQSIQESEPSVKQLQPRTIKDSPEEVEGQRRHEEIEIDIAQNIMLQEKCERLERELKHEKEVKYIAIAKCQETITEYSHDNEDLRTEIEVLREKLAKLRKQPEWLPYPENKPTEDGLCFVTLRDERVVEFSWSMSGGWGPTCDAKVVAFWSVFSCLTPAPYQPPKPKSVVEQAEEAIVLRSDDCGGMTDGMIRSVVKALNEAGLLRKDDE